jgi:antitoxin CcdA
MNAAAPTTDSEKLFLTAVRQVHMPVVRRAFDGKPRCAYRMRMHTQEVILMLAAYNPHAPKRAANLSVNGDLLNKAKELDINLSATLEQALAEALKKKQREQWLAENRKAINAYNQHVEAHGVFSDDLRSF